MYVTKVIDRANEKDGIKFWRFPHDYRKQGIFDKIFGVLSAVKKDLMDPKDGHDLVINIARDQNGNAIVQSINAVFTPSALCEDEAKAQSWINDVRTWESVYMVKPYDYLEIIVKGGIPEYSKELKSYVDKNSITKADPSASKEEEGKIGGVKKNVQAATKPAAAVAATVTADDEMPF